MKLIVGLGNPGPEYAKTRHNVGFMAIDRLAQRHGLSGAKTKFHAGVLEGPVAGEKCLLLQPMTYMNRSGKAVAEAVNFYKLALEDVMIIVDDIALPCGTIRLRTAGSAGGHNGLADIQRALSSNAYPRLRIGVDAPGASRRLITCWVSSRENSGTKWTSRWIKHAMRQKHGSATGRRR